MKKQARPPRQVAEPYRRPSGGIACRYACGNVVNITPGLGHPIAATCSACRPKETGRAA